MKNIIILFSIFVLTPSISIEASSVKNEKQLFIDHWTYVETYGANGNDSNDDKQAIQNALNAAYNVSLSAGKVYYLSGTVTIPEGKVLQIPAGAQLIYRGTGGTALIIKKSATLIGEGTLRIPDVKIGPWNWSSIRTAIQVKGANAKIDLALIEGFEKGIYMNGADSINCCNISVRYMYDNVIGFHLQNTASGYIKNNYFHTDQMSDHRHSTPGQNQTVWANSVGVLMEGSPHTNTFSGHIEAYTTGIRLSGVYNHIASVRLEACKVKILIDDPNTRINYLFGEYGEIYGLEDYLGLDTFPVRRLISKPLFDLLSVFGWDKHTYLNDLKSNGITVSSDARLKENIENISAVYALNKLQGLRSVKYNYITADTLMPKQETYGFVAQEILQVLPELVRVNPLDSMYTVNYNQVIPFLVETYKAQNRQLVQDSLRLADLKQNTLLLLELVQKIKKEKVEPIKPMQQSVIDLDMSNEIYAYPNPTSGFLTVVSGTAKIISWQLIDSGGRVLLSGNAESENQSQLNLQHLTNGFYLLLVKTETETKTLQILLDK